MACSRRLLDCEQSLFSRKSTGKHAKQVSVWAWLWARRASGEPWCHEPLVVQVSEDERKERLQWYNTLDATLTGQINDISALFLNMTLRCLIFHPNQSKLYAVRCDEWFDILWLQPDLWHLKNFYTARSNSSTLPLPQSGKNKCEA